MKVDSMPEITTYRLSLEMVSVRVFTPLGHPWTAVTPRQAGCIQNVSRGGPAFVIALHDSLSFRETTDISCTESHWNHTKRGIPIQYRAGLDPRKPRGMW